MDNKKLINIANTLKDLLEKSGIPVENIAIFGSVMKGTDKAESDIDMIVISKAFENKNIFKRADMLYKPETEFMRIIKMPVDIISYTRAEYLESLESKRLESRILI
ncbi:MAG TPA: nucleotidyltransferase domain-containing protein [Melioribacteraceae bacterium]|nr:nucleotidyltransferase domain-containing protein [Melioribacteraceae bacterium]